MHKKIGLLAFISVSVFLFSYTSGIPIKIKGNFKNVKQPYIYVYRYFGPEVYKIDSVKHEGGQFLLKFKELSRGFYKIGMSEENSLMVLLGEENISITADADNLLNSAEINESKENEVYKRFQSFNEKHSLEVNNLNQQAKALAGDQYNNPQKYNIEIKKLQGKLDSLNSLQRNFYTTTIEANKGLFVSRFLTMFNFPDTLTKENFFNKEDFTDIELTRGDMLSSKISFYMQRFITPQLDQWKIAADEVLKKAPAATKNREVVYLTFIRLFQPYDDVYARSLTKTYSKEFPESEFPKRVLASLPKSAPDIGDMAPEITLTNPLGKNMSLSSYKGKIVLLDFWASWCGPCRGENPNVVRVYNKYKDKGFTVFSVSLDNAKDKWIQAIATDNLTWEAHVSDLKGWKSSAAALYGVKGIPATFLIGKDGKVIAANLRGESLEAMLKTLLGE